MNRKKLLIAVQGFAVALIGGSAHAQSGPAPTTSGDDSAAYNRELLSVEEEVHALKEDVFRSKATLQLLKEIVIQGASAGSRATLWHLNQLSQGYVVESATYYLDGQGKFSKADPTGGLDQMKEFKVWEGAVTPGNHDLTVSLQLRGNGFGVFSYVKDYTFNVQSTTTFTAEEGKSCSVKVIADERKGVAKSFIEKPDVRFETQCIRLVESAGGVK